jgi:NADH:ubiquinone oxidoreductase subunit 6 (subunit J)
MTVPAFLFYAFAVLAVVSALGMVLNVRNTVAGAMSLVVTMVALAGIYVLLEAHLVAVIQIMVYGGAIDGFGGYREVGLALYTDYLLLVEMISLLLTAAIVGALILAQRKIG